jgi:hypothetical protein
VNSRTIHCHPFLLSRTFAKLGNGFWDRLDQTTQPTGDRSGKLGVADAADVNDAPGAPSVDTGPRDFEGPGQFLAIELRSEARRESVWAPYDGQQSLSSLIEDISIERRLACRSELFYSTDPDFLSRVKEMLSAATERNTMAVVFLDPLCLAAEEARDQLKLLVQAAWRGGIFVPIDASCERTLSLTQRHSDVFDVSPDRQQQIVLRQVSGSVDDFRVSVLSILGEIRRLIVKYGEVYQPIPSNPRPEIRPRITNVKTSEMRL